MSPTAKPLHAYMAYDRDYGSEEGAVLVFARTAREARRLGWPYVRSWCDTEWIAMAATRLSDDALHHATAEQLGRGEPFVIETPTGCWGCERWFSEPLDENGRCEACADGADEDGTENFPW